MNRLSFYGLVVFIFSLPLQDIISLPGGGALSLSRLVGLVLIIAALGATLRRGTLQLRVPAVTLLLTGVFCIWAIASSLWNVWDSSSALIKSVTYLQLAIMSLLIWQLCKNKRDHMILLQAFVLGAYIVAGRIVFDYATNPFVPNSLQSMERYVGLGSNPNNVATTMALALPLAWFLGNFWARGLLKWLNILYLPLAVLAVILTASRGGAVVALAGLTIVPLTFRYLRPRSRIAVVVLSALSVGLLASVIPVANFTRIAETSSEISTGSVSNRGAIWQAGLQLYTQSPIIGIGNGSFPLAVEPILGYRKAAHNAFLLILIETGIIGFVLFTANFFVVLRPLLSLTGADRMLYLSLWLALVVSMLPSNVEDAQYVWALLILMATRRAYTVDFFSGQRSATGYDALPPSLQP